MSAPGGTQDYKSYFASAKYAPILKTRDVDLPIPQPSAIRAKTDVAELLKDLGFVIGFTGSQGYIRLEHPELIVEFLVVEKGRPSDKPYPVPQLGVNAQPLRFLELLARDTITAKVKDVSVRLPHPAHFALHKLLVLQRRGNPEKIEKDKDAAVRILEALSDKGERDFVKKVFNSQPSGWQKKIHRALAEVDSKDVSSIFQ